MQEVEKKRNGKVKKASEKPSQLYAEVMEARKNIPPKEEVLVELTAELEGIATKLNLTIDALLEKAENSSDFMEEYFRANNIARQIARLKK